MKNLEKLPEPSSTHLMLVSPPGSAGFGVSVKCITSGIAKRGPVPDPKSALRLDDAPHRGRGVGGG